MAREVYPFSSGRNYGIGDLTLHDGIIYEFIAFHAAGGWDEDDVRPYDVNGDYNRILAAMDTAIKYSAYADTMVFAPSQISGTRYKYVFTNAEDPR